MTIPFVRPDVRAHLDMINANGALKVEELPIEQGRAMFAMMKNIVDLPDVPLAVVRDIAIPGPAGTIPARLYDARETRTPSPVMVFYHGGGFVIGDLESHQPFCTEAAKLLDIPVIAIDYRLAPEHIFPAAADDCEAAARWIASSPAELGRTITGLVPCGDSAGGNLAIVTSIALRDKPAAVPVLAQCPFYPVVSTTPEWQSMVDFAEGYFLTAASMTWFGAANQWDEGNPRAAPILADLAGLPPTVLTTAGLDPLRDQGRAFAAKLADAGVPVAFREAKGNIHGFLNFRLAIPSSQHDMLGALNALKALMAEHAA